MLEYVLRMDKIQSEIKRWQVDNKVGSVAH